MLVGSWNIRGLNDPYKQQEIRALIRRNNLSFLSINETRVREGNSLAIIQHLMPGWLFATNYTHHIGGRIWILWDPNVLLVQVKMITDQLIHVQAMIIQQQRPIEVSCIYGLNYPVPRRTLWRSLCLLSDSMGEVPWLVFGDYNIFRKPSENLGGANDCPDYIDDLNDCCQECLLEDLRYTGYLHTWSDRKSVV